MIRLHLCFFLIFFQIYQTFSIDIPSSSIPRQNPVIVLNLTGSMHEMGMKYGLALSNELRDSLDILKEFFQNRGQTYQHMLQRANSFHERYTDDWNWFLKGMAAGSGLTYDDCKILNAMETFMAGPKNSTQSGCAFVYVPSSKTTSGHALIGRNYDYPSPFEKIGKNIIVTIFHQESKIPTAIIGMPAQIYCPTCINANGQFLELNNGAPSGGAELDEQVKPSMLVKMLDLLRSKSDFNEISKELNKSRSDYSLIVNAASEHGGVSFEYSTRNRSVKSVNFDEKTAFVSTNFFLNPDWSLPPPTDNETFIGVTRRENLMKLFAKYQPISMDKMKKIMDMKLTDGGAKYSRTIFQVVFDYGTKILALKVPKTSDEWIDIDLGLFF